MQPSVGVTIRYADSELNKLELIIDSLNVYGATARGLIAEIVLIRAAAVFESAIAEAAYKLAAGAPYLDLSHPILTRACATKAAARDAMLSHGRRNRLQHLKWTSASSIKASASLVIDPNEHFFSVCDAFGPNIREMFEVRNFVAHRSTTSRTKYKAIVRRIYGVNRLMPISQFLLSTRMVSIPNIKRYILEAKVILRSSVKG